MSIDRSRKESKQKLLDIIKTTNKIVRITPEERIKLALDYIKNNK